MLRMEYTKEASRIRQKAVQHKLLLSFNVLRTASRRGVAFVLFLFYRKHGVQYAQLNMGEFGLTCFVKKIPPILFIEVEISLFWEEMAEE